MKKIYFILMALFLSTSAFGEKFEYNDLQFNTISDTEAELVSYVSSHRPAGFLAIPEKVPYNGKEYTVTSIGSNAFYNCDRLTSVEIPNTVVTIGYRAFSYCIHLTDIKIGNSVKRMGKYVFLYCCSLTRIEISDLEAWCRIKVEGLYDEPPLLGYYYLYLNNEVVTDLVIPQSITSIGDYAFFNFAGIQSVTIPNSVTKIGRQAFRECIDMTHLELSNSLTEIGNEAFWLCSSLASLELPNSITKIGGAAFSSCASLKSLTIGNALYASENSPFGGCPIEILKIDCPKINTWFSYVRSLKNLIIGDSVEEIQEDAFENCTGLTNVTMGNSVKKIGVHAFRNCSALADIEFSDSLEEIGEESFWDCTALSSLEIPGSVTVIGENAFYPTSFDSFVLKDGVSELKIKGWGNKIKAKNLYQGRNITGRYSFAECERLEVGGFVESIPANTYNVPTLTSVIINPGEGVAIEDEAFSGCSDLTELLLPGNVSEIGANAFSGTGLKDVTVPSGLIAAQAFSECDIDNIVLGANVESIGEKAFDGSNSIQSVYATPVTPPEVSDDTFSSYEALLMVPDVAIDNYFNYPCCWNQFSGKPLVCPENITLDVEPDIIGKPGETFRLSATISPADVTLDRVLWHSTNLAIATVDNNGLVTLQNFRQSAETMALAEETGRFCQIIASTLYENSPVAVVNIEVMEDSVSVIEKLDANETAGSAWSTHLNEGIYTLQGVCVKHNASRSDIDALRPGIYIIGGNKVVVR